MKLVVLVFIIFSTTSFSLFKPKPIAKIQLRKNYIAALMRYEGEPYSTSGDYWGINCSTLARQALINTFGIDDTTRANIRLEPCLSEQLGEGCNGELSLVVKGASLNSINYSKIKPGDIAIVGNTVGIHTLAYKGNKTWIQADPFAEKVVETTVPNDEYWFTLKVRVMRWNVFIDRK